ncbi:hypothetical protein [Staphylococcus epidermidis]|mgnify:FL=1|uniref:hypothetical protein n=1 Tax=Staphylococcus epidermidis TaxID=1282 RepID=UPI00066EA352|nr:hypothetical protein [Staphylococcus epidermidis]
MKKFLGILLIVMSIALVGCSNSNDSDQSSNEKSSSKSSEKKTDVATEYTKEDEYKELEKEAKDLKQKPVLNEIDALITEKGFTNKTGLQGWEDYKKLMDKVTLADYKYTKESKGSSIEEVNKFFKDKKGVEIKRMKSKEKNIKHINYMYVDPDGKKTGKNKQPMSYAQILATFKEGKLVATNIQPGFFALDKKKMVKAKDLEEVKTLEDLTRLKDPKATSYGILQTKYKGKPYTQVSILGSDSDEENDISSAILAYYLFSPTELDSDDNHKYVEVASAPFLSAQNDFSSYQLGVFKKIIESSMSFDE